MNDDQGKQLERTAHMRDLVARALPDLADLASSYGTERGDLVSGGELREAVAYFRRLHARLADEARRLERVTRGLPSQARPAPTDGAE